MPAWKAKMIKERTTGGSDSAKKIWQNWLKTTNEEAAAARHGGRSRGTTPSRRASRGASVVGGNDAWRECGAVPRINDRFKEGPNLGKLPNFYIYTDEPFEWRDLLTCYKERFGVDAWEDERMWELAQNTGALWLHEALLRHPRRVTRPDEADIFFVPVDAYVSFKAGACKGSEHRARMDAARLKLARSHWWSRKGGADHVFIAPWWGAKAAWGKELWALAKDAAVLVTFDEGFAHDWNKVVVAPYVAHALLTKKGGSRCEGRRETLLSMDRRGTVDREINLYFRGSVMHGVNCKYGDTWVRKAAYAAMARMEEAHAAGGAGTAAGGHRALFVATESSSIADRGVIKLREEDQTEEERRVKTQENQGHFAAGKYASELLRSEFCIHFRGDTTTSRRVFDAVAAGCVPVLISDNTHLPFTSSINWAAFTVAIPERALLTAQTPEKVVQIFEKLVEDRQLLRAKQLALVRVRQDLLYGFGSPLEPDPAFPSRVADHVLGESDRAVKHPGKYRRFKDPSKSCVKK